MAENVNLHFIKKDIQMASSSLKRFSTLLIITEMQYETTIRYDHHSLEWLTLKIIDIKFWQGCRTIRILICGSLLYKIT